MSYTRYIILFCMFFLLYHLFFNLSLCLLLPKIPKIGEIFIGYFRRNSPLIVKCVYLNRLCSGISGFTITVGMFKSSMLVLLLLAWSGYWAKKATEEAAKKLRKGGEEEPGYGMTVLQEPVQVFELNLKALRCTPSCGRRLLSSPRDRMI